jgi:DHA3 family tetracycline resistance protein-like MFS transporter
VYYGLTGVSAFAYALCFTLNLVFQVEVIGLEPLQMVLVGTMLELSIFVFEVPTGIVADLHSRRLSAVIGFALVGVGFMLEGIIATFAAAMLAQLVWGIGYTFTSGAVEAWVTDEVGDERIHGVFTRGTQVELSASIAGAVTAGALGLVALRVPIVAAGATFVALAVGLLLVMPERHFAPTPRAERETFRHLRGQLVAGLQVARRRRVVRAFLFVSLLVGLASEVVDRLWTVRVLDDFDMPAVFGGDEAIAFAAFALVGTTVSLGASLASGRWLPAHLPEDRPALPVVVAALTQVAAVVGLALLGNLWLVLAAVWVRSAAQAFSAPIERAWLNRNLDSATRATVLSMNGQLNAVGQVAGGPPLGALANVAGIPVALLASAALQLPTAAIFARVRRLAGRPERETEGAASTA